MISTVEKYYLEGVWKNSYIITYDSGNTVQAPHNEANRHYQEILKWVAEGNTITDNGGA